MEPHELAGKIDHTLLKPEATAEQILRLCHEAMTNSFATVCVNPYWVDYCYRVLNSEGSTVNVCSVIGFPLGANITDTKILEARTAIENGAEEIDMVMNIGALKDRNITSVARDIEFVRKTTGGHILKVIIEACLLTDKEKAEACRLAVNAGADFVKTSTGFSSGGATLRDVELMRDTVGPNVGVKAAGGIRDMKTAISMLAAGANRLGCSAGVAIIEQMKEELARESG